MSSNGNTLTIFDQIFYFHHFYASLEIICVPHYYLQAPRHNLATCSSKLRHGCTALYPLYPSLRSCKHGSGKAAPRDFLSKKEIFRADAKSLRSKDSLFLLFRCLIPFLCAPAPLPDRPLSPHQFCVTSQHRRR